MKGQASMMKRAATRRIPKFNDDDDSHMSALQMMQQKRVKQLNDAEEEGISSHDISEHEENEARFQDKLGEGKLDTWRHLKLINSELNQRIKDCKFGKGSTESKLTQVTDVKNTKRMSAIIEMDDLKSDMKERALAL